MVAETGCSGMSRIGIDLGGTKIEGVLLGPDGTVVLAKRIPTPRDDYAGTLEAIAGLVAYLEDGLQQRCTVGVGVPGSLSPATGCLQNANSTWLNGQPLDRDLALRLGRPVRITNDANCFALSEATDGAGAGARTVLGLILGTGCGAGIVIGGRILDGPRGTGGEWGHNPLPPATADELPGPICWCGRKGCIETWVSGPGLAADHQRVSGERLTAEEVGEHAAQADAAAQATLDRHAARLARALAPVVNILDPDVVVIGGGLSKLAHLYDVLPRLLRPLIFADVPDVTVLPPKWGDASGARGAAWLGMPAS